MKSITKVKEGDCFMFLLQVLLESLVSQDN